MDRLRYTGEGVNLTNGAVPPCSPSLRDKRLSWFLQLGKALPRSAPGPPSPQLFFPREWLVRGVHTAKTHAGTPEEAASPLALRRGQRRTLPAPGRPRLPSRLRGAAGRPLLGAAPGRPCPHGAPQSPPAAGSGLGPSPLRAARGALSSRKRRPAPPRRAATARPRP